MLFGLNVTESAINFSKLNIFYFFIIIVCFVATEPVGEFTELVDVCLHLMATSICFVHCPVIVWRTLFFDTVLNGFPVE